MDWSTYYPAFVAPQEPRQETTNISPAFGETGSTIPTLIKDVEVADIGCGFGGLLVALAPKLPDKLLLGKSIEANLWTASDDLKAWRLEYR